MHIGIEETDVWCHFFIKVWKYFWLPSMCIFAVIYKLLSSIHVVKVVEITVHCTYLRQRRQLYTSSHIVIIVGRVCARSHELETIPCINIVCFCSSKRWWWVDKYRDEGNDPFCHDSRPFLVVSNVYICLQTYVIFTWMYYTYMYVSNVAHQSVSVHASALTASSIFTITYYDCISS